MRLFVALVTLLAFVSLGWTLFSAAFLALETGREPRPDRRGLGWLSREWAAAMVTFTFRLTGWWQPDPRPSRGVGGRDPGTLPPPTASLPPVLLVPGYGLHRLCWSFAAIYLRRRGWRWVWPIHNRPLSGSIPVLAHNLGRRVEQLRAASGADKVDLVAHSMGGLVCAFYLQQLGGDRHVRRLVTVGTPWHGSKTSVFAIFRQARDLRPGSELTTMLGPPTVPTTCIWSPEDNIVLPPESALREGTEQVCLRWTGHLTMLASSAVFRAIAQALTSPGGSDPSLLVDHQAGDAQAAVDTAASPSQGTPPPDDDRDRAHAAASS